MGFNVAGEPPEFCERRTPTGGLGNRPKHWTYPLFLVPRPNSYRLPKALRVFSRFQLAD